jgi:ribose transport system substrate-binding protein
MQVIIPNGMAGPTAETAYQTTKGFLARYSTEIVGLFSPHALSTEGALRALRETKLAGDKVKLVGFGQSEELCAALELGELQGLIAEDYFLWGYLSVKSALEALKGKPVKPRIEVPFALVLKENLSDPIIQMILGKIPRAKIVPPAPAP